jgi:hypothetical protein
VLGAVRFQKLRDHDPELFCEFRNRIRFGCKSRYIFTLSDPDSGVRVPTRLNAMDLYRHAPYRRPPARRFCFGAGRTWRR